MASDQEIFDSAIAKEPVTTTPEPAAPEPGVKTSVETPSGRLKDPETGKFIAKTPKEGEGAPVAPAPAAVTADPKTADQAPTSSPEAHIPSWRLAEETQRRREAEQAQLQDKQRLAAMERELQQLRQQAAPKPEPIDPMADPEGFRTAMQQGFAQEMRNQEVNFSFRLAHMKHGEAFEQAFSEMERLAQGGDKSVVQSVMRSPDPGTALVNWYRRESTIREVGTDPTTWLQKKQEEWLKDPAVQAKVIEAVRATGAQPQPQTQVSLPPSLSSVAAAAPAVGGAEDASGAGLYAFATAKQR